MKKIYSSPQVMVVQLSAKTAILGMSVNSTREISGENAGLVKEQTGGDSWSSSGSSVWDDEW